MTKAATVVDPPSITTTGELPLNLKGRDVTFQGSCNGIVCLTTPIKGCFHDTEVLLWNPFTNKSFELLPSPDIDTNREGYRRCKPDLCGFGHDDVTDDYKVVRLVQLMPSWAAMRTMMTSRKVVAQVYSLRTISLRHVSDRIFPDVLFPLHKNFHGGLAKGALHWLVSSDTGKGHSILGLDLSTESYRLLSLPAGCPHDRIHVGEIDGCLGLMMCQIYHKGPDSYHVWIMKEYGLNDSWTKLISLHPSLPVPKTKEHGVCAVYKKGFVFKVSSSKTLRYCETQKELDCLSAASIIANYKNIDNNYVCIDGYVVAPTLVGCSPPFCS